MKLISPVIAALIVLLSICGVAAAAPLKTYVAEFNVSGVQGKDDLKVVLQGVLASRLNPEQVQLVKTKNNAELTITGSYATFGKIFSLDVQIENTINNSLSRVFETGSGEDDLLPAIVRLSGKIERELAKNGSSATTVKSVPSAAQDVSKIAGGAVVSGAYQVRSDEGGKSAAGSWTSPPIPGTLNSIALGRLLANGDREIFVAGEDSIRYYLKSSEMKLVAEVTIPSPAKVLSIDTADLDNDGVPELYVTVYDREKATSRVYVPQTSGLDLVQSKLPWFFRGLGQDYKKRIIFTQEMGVGGVLRDSLAELVKSEKNFSTRKPFKLKNAVNIFSFNMLPGPNGKNHFVSIDEDGYLLVSTPDGEEVWKSSNKYGGSEKHFKVEAADGNRTFGDGYRRTFLEQRIVITPDGMLLVPRNEGMFNVGFSRSYTKYTLHALAWNGSSMKEKWHTSENQSYLADFAYDAATKELILLEVVQKAGMFSKGITVISINRVD